MRIKICGITSVEDAKVAADAGADAIGLVFYEPSPRYVTLEQAAEIARSVGPFVTVVGLFVNAEQDQIEQVLQQVPLQLLQFHGDETASFCECFSRPYMKAIRMKAGVDLNATMDEYASAQGLLLDAYRPGVPGGTGETFDWERVPQHSSRPIILAGGLTADNVQQAIKQTQPYAVDVSGGVELAPGKKDAGKVAAFIRNARQ